MKKPLFFLTNIVHVVYLSFPKSPVFKEKGLFLYVSIEFFKVVCSLKGNLFFLRKNLLDKQFFV